VKLREEERSLLCNYTKRSEEDGNDTQDL
jgi:hypothetical protein